MLPRQAVPLWQLTLLTLAYFVAGKLGLLLALSTPARRRCGPLRESR